MGEGGGGDNRPFQAGFQFLHFNNIAPLQWYNRTISGAGANHDK